MLAAGFVEGVGDLGQRLDDRLIFGTLQSSTRSGLVTARRWQSTHICGATGFERVAECFVVAGAVGGGADGVEFERPAADAELVEQRGQHLQHFGVAQRRFAAGAGRPDDLGADLRELAVAPLLRTLAAKLRTDVIELLQLAGVRRACARCRRGRRRRCFRGGGSATAPSRLRRGARSSQVYISLETMSVSSPTPRAKSCVSSKMGVRISPKL